MLDRPPGWARCDRGHLQVGLPTTVELEVDHVVTDDHGCWIHTTLLARATGDVPELRARSFETKRVRWVVAEISAGWPGGGAA